MLSFTDFKERFIADCRVMLLADLRGAISIETGKVNKPQRGELTGLRFVKKGSRVAPTLYAEDLYARYAQGCPIDRVVQEAIESIRSSFDVLLPFPEDDFDLSGMMNDVRPRLLSKERNPLIAQSVPHMDVGGGLMLIADIVRGDFRAMITKDMLEDSGITEDELFETALNNIPQGEAVMYGLSEMVNTSSEERTEMLGYKADSGIGEDSIERPDDFEVFVLSNREMVWGSAALFYPGVIDRLHDMLGVFYVIPSSVHELLILPASADFDPENISGMIWSANRSVVDEEDVLSDDLYICDSDKLRVAIPGDGSSHNGSNKNSPGGCVTTPAGSLRNEAEYCGGSDHNKGLASVNTVMC